VYGVPILVGEGTARVSSDRYLFREVDRVRVKGKPMPILIFELIGRRGDAGERPPLVELFERGLIAYHERRFLEAYELFNNCATDFQDPVSGLYINRCLHYLDHPPPTGWDGVYELAQ
jgi:adenylate cyclase